MFCTKIKKLNRAAAVCTAAVVIFSGSLTAFASTPQVVAAPGAAAAGALTFQQGLEAAVVKAFDGLAEEAGAEVVAVITPEVDAIAAEVAASVEGIKTEKENTELSGFVMDTSAYPPASVINSIPSQALPQVRAQVQAEIETAIAADFAKSEKLIQAQVKQMMETAAPQIAKDMEPALQKLVPKIHSIIEARIEASIEDEILLVLPDLMPLIPAEMQNMTPEEIAAQMKSVIKPKIEAAVRPDFEAKIKAQIDALMVEKIKEPMEAKFAPKLSAMDASVYNSFIDQLPSYLETVISKDFIKAVVSKNVAALQAKLPSLVESSRAGVDQEINDYIDSMIEKETKIYIGQSYVDAPVAPRVVNNRLLVPFRAIATALGATVEWRYKERQVVMKKGDTTIVLTINSDVVLVNGKTAKIDAAAGIYENSTLVPVRFIAETFNMEVNWQPDWKMVNIEAAQ